MIENYRKTRKTHSRGTRAAQPAATNVLEGTLYFVTDEGITEQSNGLIWVSYSGSGSGSISIPSSPILMPVFDGEDGFDGFSGQRGLDGVAGISGIAGISGMPGLDGIDGESLETFLLNLTGIIPLVGPWIPIDDSGAGLTFTTAVGRYCKLGPMVFMSMNVTYPSTLNGSTAFIGGFPFATQADANVYWGGAITYTDSIAATMNVNNNATKTALYTVAPSTPLVNSQLSLKTVIMNMQFFCKQ